MDLKNKNGISLITVIITVVVIVILTTIAMATTSEIPDEANFSKYVNEIKNVQIGVDDAKIKNAFKGTTEEKLTAGFEKVYLENAPGEFLSFDEDIYQEKTGYLISLDEIGYDEAEFGKLFKNFESGDTLKFGEKECDVYVFDATWKVFYVKGLKYDGSMNYTVD